MQLADHASAVVHPLVRVLDGPVKELRKDALIALTSLANSLGSDFLLFLPLVRRTIKKRSMRDPVFERIVERLEAERVQGGLNSGFNNAGQLGVKMTINPNPNPSPFTSVTDSPIGGSDDHLPGESQRGANRRRRSRDSNRDMDIRGNSLHGGYSLRHLSLANPSEGLVVDEAALRRAWESSQRSTKEDWLEWMRHLSVELLKQSPSPALRACIDLAMVQPHLARDLFCASFVSCWSELSAVHRDQLVRSLEAAFGSPTIPPEIVTTLLNLAEFCEHDEKPLPVDIRTLGMIAERCRAYAKALHYKETEFVSNPAGCVEAIIAINNQLQLPEAAMGVLVYAQAHLRLEIKEGWYEKLGQWDEALGSARPKSAGG
jgi:FKBP12-rapamycin complex-associated protein